MYRVGGFTAWPFLALAFLLAGGVLFSLSGCAGTGVLSGERRYGPSRPSGYYVRLDPGAIHMAHNRPFPVTVTVEDAARQPMNDVSVRFTPSRGQVSTSSDVTRDGSVTGIYTAPAGSDGTYSDVVTVGVEDLEVTVFVDIVPAVFGR